MIASGPPLLDLRTPHTIIFAERFILLIIYSARFHETGRASYQLPYFSCTYRPGWRLMPPSAAIYFHRSRRDWRHRPRRYGSTINKMGHRWPIPRYFRRHTCRRAAFAFRRYMAAIGFTYHVTACHAPDFRRHFDAAIVDESEIFSSYFISRFHHHARPKLPPPAYPAPHTNDILLPWHRNRRTMPSHRMSPNVRFPVGDFDTTLDALTSRQAISLP